MKSCPSFAGKFAAQYEKGSIIIDHKQIRCMECMSRDVDILVVASISIWQRPFTDVTR